MSDPGRNPQLGFPWRAFAALADCFPRPVPVWMTAFVLLLLLGAQLSNHAIDLDHFHQMALARESLNAGRLLIEDPYAFTPTVSPFIHHEWGHGFLCLFLVRELGAIGLILLKLLLITLLAVCCCAVARVRGAKWQTVILLAFPVLCVFSLGMTTVRAQLFTFLGLAFTLLVLEKDRARSPRRLLWWFTWLVYLVLWTNLHGGFVIGPAVLGLHGIEQLLRRRPFLHLLPVGAAAFLATLINPYGIELHRCLLHALTLDRPHIREWYPLWKLPWQTYLPFILLLALSVIPPLAAVRRAGLSALDGIAVIVFLGLESVLHLRFIPLYAIAWLCCAPRWAEYALSPDRWAGARRLLRPWGVAALVFVLVGSLTGFANRRPFEISVAAMSRKGHASYPVGAVEYLRAGRISCRLMTHYNDGAYVMWHLYPRVTISMDGRYEAAYPPQLAEENFALYSAFPGWRDTLAAREPDAILCHVTRALAPELLRLEAEGWCRAYIDHEFILCCRPGLDWPIVDRRGETLIGDFEKHVRAPALPGWHDRP